MTITKDVTAKFAVAIVAVAMVFSAFATSAKAQTTDDLQKMINDLLAQVASLQSEAGQGATSAAGVCPYTWTRDLNTGATGADVKMLQQFLNADADTRVSAEGVGSAGMETEYYGPATAAAVSKLQVKYRADILSPANLVNPTGYFGPSTRAKANALCVAAPVVEEEEEGEATEEEEEEEEAGELGGEASLDSFEIDAADEDTIEEGAEDAEVAMATLEFTDGDAEISRIDVSLVGDVANAEVDPWDVFETVSLWVDGDKVAEEAADDSDEYLDEDDGSIRFSGLDLVAMEDEEVEITVAVTVQSNLDGMPEDWSVAVDAVRFFDADGVATTEDSGFEFGDTVDFTIDEAGYEDEIIVKSSSNDPEATTLIVKDDAKSDWLSVFVFDLDTDDSTNDVELDTVAVDVTTGTADVEDVIYDAEVVIDGETYDDWSFTGVSSSTAAGIEFDINGDHVVEAGDRVEVEVRLRFAAVNGVNYAEGETVTVVADAAATNGEAADDLTASGAASGETHTLRSAGIVADAASVEVDEDTQGDNDITGIFTISFDVEALEGDFYVTDYADTDATTLTGGVLVSVDGPAAPTTVSGTLASTADEDTPGVFTIREGETETFTVTVTVDASATGQHRVSLDQIIFSDNPNGVTGSEAQDLLPESTYRTGYININAA